MLEETQDEQEIIGRIAALDIGKAELVCCVREVLAQLARASMRKKIPQLEGAFVGYFTEHLGQLSPAHSPSFSS